MTRCLIVFLLSTLQSRRAVTAPRVANGDLGAACRLPSAQGSLGVVSPLVVGVQHKSITKYNKIACHPERSRNFRRRGAPSGENRGATATKGSRNESCWLVTVLFHSCFYNPSVSLRLPPPLAQGSLIVVSPLEALSPASRELSHRASL